MTLEEKNEWKNLPVLEYAEWIWRKRRHESIRTPQSEPIRISIAHWNEFQIYKKQNKK